MTKNSQPAAARPSDCDTQCDEDMEMPRGSDTERGCSTVGGTAI